MSDSVRPHRWQPTRLLHPWDSPGKNPRVGCHFLLQCMKVKSESEVAQSSPTLHDPMDCSPSDSVQGIFQARVLEWGAIAFSDFHVKTMETGSCYLFSSCPGWDRGWLGFCGGSAGKESACSAGDLGLIPGLGRSPGEGNGNPLQFLCLENPMDTGVCCCCC